MLKIEFHRKKSKFHSINGPAIKYPNGDNEWWFNGKCHRLDGPACEYKHANIKYWDIYDRNISTIEDLLTIYFNI